VPRPRRGLAALATVVLGALALPATALADDAGSATAAMGAVSASLTWDAADIGAANPHLVVTRAGVAAFDGSPVAGSDSCRDGYCSFAPSGKRKGPLQVLDLDRDGEPEILTDVYSGGAHCCALTEVMHWNGTAYTTTEAYWGNVGYEVKDLDADGRPELVAADDVFAGAFTSFAASFFPPLVLDYDAAAKGGFRDVTKRFPRVVRSNMRQALHTLRTARRRHYETLGIVAAYVADLYLLGRGREARPYLKRARKRGDLRDIEGAASRRYEGQLLAFLHKQGYR
jgi:hypothetical protein